MARSWQRKLQTASIPRHACQEGKRVAHNWERAWNLNKPDNRYRHFVIVWTPLFSMIGIRPGWLLAHKHRKAIGLRYTYHCRLLPLLGRATAQSWSRFDVCSERCCLVELGKVGQGMGLARRFCGCRKAYTSAVKSSSSIAASGTLCVGVAGDVRYTGYSVRGGEVV